jgi:hypothetical protein
VSQIAFGKYLSPDYETPEKFIPPVGTRSGTPAVQGVNEIFFNLLLPSGPKPDNGWPVAIYGHGSGSDKNYNAFLVAATLAAEGIATIAINTVGNGGGPLGTLTVTPTVGDGVTFPAGGRGIDQDGDGFIFLGEGRVAAFPRTIIWQRDGVQQTVADLMQLVRELEVGMDADGDDVPDLDPARTYYAGNSFGGMYGTIFLAVEPNVRAGVPNTPGGRTSICSGSLLSGRSWVSCFPSACRRSSTSAASSSMRTCRCAISPRSSTTCPELSNSSNCSRTRNG